MPRVTVVGQCKNVNDLGIQQQHGVYNLYSKGRKEIIKPLTITESQNFIVKTTPFPLLFEANKLN